MTTLLITGAGGLLGANLVLEAQAAGLQVVAVDLGHPVRRAGVESFTADLSRPGAAHALLAARRPQWVIHCAAATNVDGCEDDPQAAFRLNRDMAGQVALAARAVGARLAHISTDAVFDGEGGPYTEQEAPRPVNVYGASKLAGEHVVRAEHPEAVIVRTNIYGWNAQPKHSLAEWFLARLEAGQECPGFTHARFSPILVNDLGVRLFELLRAGAEGLYHVAGSECITKYAFGARLAEVFGLPRELVIPSGARESKRAARRGAMLCLDSGKASRQLEKPMPAVSDGLVRLKRLRAEGWVEKLQSLVNRPPDEDSAGPTDRGVRSRSAHESCPGSRRSSHVRH